MNKKIIMLTGIGLVSFTLSFGLSFFMLNKSQPADSSQQTAVAQQAAQLAASAADKDFNFSVPKTGLPSNLDSRELKELVYDLRQKINEYDTKLRSLSQQQQRLEMAKAQFENDITELDSLRSDLANGVGKFKAERNRLSKTVTEIAELEKKNLITIAASYDKMDSSSAGKILVNMSQGQNGSITDAVKILYYMGDRTKAKVLASIADSEPAMAAYFSQKLKNLTEVR